MNQNFVYTFFLPGVWDSTSSFRVPPFFNMERIKCYASGIWVLFCQFFYQTYAKMTIKSVSCLLKLRISFVRCSKGTDFF